MKAGVAYISWNRATGITKWAVYTGATPTTLQFMGMVAKSGFETACNISSGDRYLQVGAYTGTHCCVNRSLCLSDNRAFGPSKTPISTKIYIQVSSSIASLLHHFVFRACRYFIPHFRNCFFYSSHDSIICLSFRSLYLGNIYALQRHKYGPNLAGFNRSSELQIHQFLQIV